MPDAGLAPSVLPVRLADRSYLVDLTDYQRSVIAALRTDSDTTARTGEASLSNQGLWFRWADSFHWGAGQHFVDLDPERAGRSSNRYQYWRSAHLDPWEPHQLRMARKLRDVHDVHGPTVRLHRGLSNVFLIDGNDIFVSSDGALWNPVTSLPWGTAVLHDLNTGVNAAYAATANGLWRSNFNAGVATGWEQLAPGDITMVLPHGGEVLYGVGTQLRRLLRGPAGEWTSELIFEHADPHFRWNLRSSGPDGWYVGGIEAVRSELFRITVDPTEASRLINTGNVLALPNGEQLLFARFYVGVWLLGTNRGFRLGLVDASGIVIQPLVPIGACPDVVAEGDTVWAATYGTTDVPMGTVRIEPQRFTEPGVPAWAPDVGWDEYPDYPLTAVQPHRLAVSRVADRTLVASALGVLRNRTYDDLAADYATYDQLAADNPTYYDLFTRRWDELSRVWLSTDVCEEHGFLEPGIISFGIPFPKALHDVTVHTRPLPEGASITVAWRADGDSTWLVLGTADTVGATEHRFPGQWPSFRDLELRFTITAGAWQWTYDDLAAGWGSYDEVRTEERFGTYAGLATYGERWLAEICPVVTDWSMRATPQVEQALDQIILPLVFHSQLGGGVDGRQEVYQDVHAELCYLTDLCRRQVVVPYAEAGAEPVHVKLTGAQIVPSHWSYDRAMFGYLESILQVSLQVLDPCQPGPVITPLKIGRAHV